MSIDIEENQIKFFQQERRNLSLTTINAFPYILFKAVFEPFPELVAFDVLAVIEILLVTGGCAESVED